MIKDFLAAVGMVILILWVAGALDIGNFYMYYGTPKITCTTKEAK